MEVPSAPHEVSCLALTFFWDYLEPRGVPRRQVLGGLRYPPEHFDNKHHWIDYQTFLEIEQRVAALFPDEPALFHQIGQSIGDTSGFGFLRVMARALTSPFQIYSRMRKFVPRYLFPFVDIEFQRTGRASGRLSYHFDERFVPTEAFLHTINGILAGVPRMLRAPAAMVVMRRRSPVDVDFEVGFSKWLGPLELLKGIVRRLPAPVGSRGAEVAEAVAELERTNRELQEKIDALSCTQTELNRKVAELSALNALGRAATSEIDIVPLIRNVVGAIGDALAGVPAAVLVAEGEPPGLMLAASVGLDPVQRRLVERLAEPHHEVTRALVSRRARSQADDSALELLPLVNRDQLVGALVLGRATADAGEARLRESMANQLAMALDNALSYRLIGDLRDNLELRVRRRTSELELARRHLEETVDRLEQFDRFKSRFFANLTHELRNQLTLLMPSMELMLAGELGPLSDAQRSTLESMERSGASLGRLAGDLLDLSRLEDSQIRLSAAEHDLATYLAGLVADAQPLVKRRRLKLRFRCALETCPVFMDLRQMERVFVNLLSNAVKFTPAGGRITVSLAREDDWAHIAFSDTGRGFPPEEAERIFERFYQAAADVAAAMGGAGIGLALAKELVELHAGSISARSEPGQGATFDVRLRLGSGHLSPAALSAVPAPRGSDREDRLGGLDDLTVQLQDEATPAGDEGGVTVLVVDDAPEIHRLVRASLQNRFRVVCAQRGEEGWAKARKHQPDLVITDLRMPDIDGLALVDRLRADPALSHVPVVMLTACAELDDRIAGLEHGVSAYLSKPFSARELLTTVRAQLDLKETQADLLMMHRLDSLETITAGLAHELNNPLNYLQNAVAQIRTDLDALLALPEGAPGGEARRTQLTGRVEKMCAVADRGVQRMGRVVELMRRYSRHGYAREVRAVRVRAAVDDVVGVILPATDRAVPVTVDVDPHHEVECVPEELGQALTNLVQNAIEALPLSAETGEAGAVHISARRRGAELELTVRDNGPGISPEDQRRVFAPFFTTKGPGRGIGLGLTLTRRLVARMGGTIQLDSALGEGTAFIVRLPVSAAQDRD